MKNSYALKMRNVFVAFFLALLMFCIFFVANTLLLTAKAEDNPTITLQVSQEAAKAGETVQIKINLVNNPGVASIKLNVAYEDFLTLQNIEYNSSLGGQATSSNYIQEGSPATLIWVNAFENFTKNEVFATLTFKIDDNAVDDSFSEISVTYNSADIYNTDETDIDLNVINGYVYVTSCIVGDINGDGNVNNKDITRLFQYLANWSVTVNEDVLDVNGDGSVNNKDITRLFQYLASWDVKAYVRKPCIVTFNGNGGILISGKQSQAVKRGDSAIAPVFERGGYTFEGFDVDYSNVTYDLIVTAQWKENDKKLETPVISKIEYDTIYWSPVDNADYYTVRVNDNYECILRGSSCSLSEVKWNGNTISNYGYVSIKVMANEHGAYASSDWSAENNSYYYVPEVKSSTTDSLIKYSIGFGYNLIEDEYLDITKCSNISVFNVGKLLTIGNYTARPHSGGTGTSYYYRSIDEFISKTKVAVEYGQTTGCILLGSVKMQINADLGFDYRSYKYNETYIYEYNWTYKDHIITNFASDNLLMYCLSDSFLKDIKRESDNTVGMNDNQLCAYIYDTYGTHAILGITTGGTYIADYIISTNDNDIAASVDVAFKLSTGGGGAIDQIIQKDFNIGIDVSENLSWKNSTTEAHYTTHIYGGSGGGSTTASGVDAAIKTWTNSLSEDNARSVKFTENGAIALSSLISYIDSSFAQKFANYVNSKADEAYHDLFDQYTKPTTLPMSVNTENGQNALRIDVSSYQSAGTLGDAYNPNLLNNILTIYPIMYGKEIDKIVVIGALDEHKTLINDFSLELSSQWKRNVEIEFENCGFVCASENGLVDDSKVTKNINIDVSYKGINYIADKQGNKVFHTSINDNNYDFVLTTTEGAALDLSTIRISGNMLALPDASKDNYTFCGWYDSNNRQVTNNLGELLPDYALTNGSIVLHSVFVPIIYEITFDNQFADIEPGTKKVYSRYGNGLYADQNCETSIPYIAVPQRTGYDFKGYYENVIANASQDASGTTRCTDEYGNFDFDSETFTGKKTLYALWTPAEYTITLINGDGMNDEILSTTYGVGMNINSVTIPQKEGYIFCGYYEKVTDNCTDNAVGTTKMINENGMILFDGASITSNATYSALWMENKFSFELNAQHTEYSVTGYAGAAFSIFIPATHNGLPVTTIGEYAFKDCTFTDVTIPESVVTISEGAFAGCNSLESITIPFVGATKDGTSNTNFGYIFGATSYSSNSNVVPSSLRSVIVTGGETIGIGFRGCGGLTSITIPDSVTSIGRYAFEGCSGLTSIIGSVEMTSVVAKQCSSSSFSVTITSGTSIGERAFYNCSGLTSITIPDSVTSIDSSAFFGCSGLTSITIPAEVTSIGDYALESCTGLASVIFAEGSQLTSIGFLIFGYCTSLESITIPDSVTSIGDRAFSGCNGLTSVTIGSGVTSISSSAFDRCSSLTSVTFAEGSQLTSISSGSFAWSPIEMATIPTNAIPYIPKNELKTVVINGGTTIQTRAFFGCTGLTSVTIGSGVTNIGSDAFSGCSGLTSVTFAEGSQLTRISSGAFSGCTGLTSITIPDSVTSIGSQAFSGCTGLMINGSAVIVGSAAKASRTSLFSVTITSGESIGTQAFSGCTGLTSITIPDSVTSIGGSAFYGCSSLTSVTIPDGVTSIGSSAFSHCSGLTSITIPDGVTSIGEGAFSGCSGLTSITIPDSVTSIGYDAFYGCYKLVEVYNQSSLNITKGSGWYGYVGYYAKEIYMSEYVSKLSTDENGYILYTDGAKVSLIGYTGSATELTLPAGITEINQGAFYGCSGLTSITIPSSVTSIGGSAFYGCSSLTSVTIPDGVTSIGSSAFSHCSGLTSITIPDGVTSIGEGAFSGCSGLTSIDYQGTKAQWDAISKGSNWNYNTGKYAIHCTDGSIDQEQ